MIAPEILAAAHARYNRVTALQARTPQVTAAHVSFERLESADTLRAALEALP